MFPDQSLNFSLISLLAVACVVDIGNVVPLTITLLLLAVVSEVITFIRISGEDSTFDHLLRVCDIELVEFPE